MAVLLVSYDLNKETKRPDIVGEVAKTDWAKLSESSYAIDTGETPEQVYNRFKKHLDGDDDFWVISLHRPYFGYGPKEVVEWLRARLR